MAKFVNLSFKLKENKSIRLTRVRSVKNTAREAVRSAGACFHVKTVTRMSSYNDPLISLLNCIETIH